MDSVLVQRHRQRHDPGERHVRSGHGPRRPSAISSKKPAPISSPHSLFKDVTAKIFARRGGRIYPARQREARSPDHSACEVRSPVKAPVASAPAASPEAATLARRLGPYRRGHDRHLQRHRRRHLLHSGDGRGPGAERLGDAERLARAAACSRLRARWPTPSSRRCGRTPAANTSTCARRSARSPRFSPAGRRSSPDSPARSPRAPSRSPTTSAASCPRPPTRRRSLTLPLPYVPLVVTPQALVAIARDRRALDRAPARLGTLRPQHPRGREGPRAHDVHRARAVDRPRVVRAAREHAHASTRRSPGGCSRSFR